jgi:ParB family chromosome partitioning protein
VRAGALCTKPARYRKDWCLMSGVARAETMREKRAESLGRRPSLVGPSIPGAQEKKFEGRRKHADACKIALDRIMRDENQPRTEFDPDALDRLAASLKARGQLQPCRVRWSDDAAHYVLVVGERRWRAAMLAGLETLDCIVVDGEMSAEDLLEDQLVENALREDLKPVEQARSYRALMTARGMTHRDLAERLNVAHTTVTRALGLLDLPESVQVQVDTGELSPSTAYAIASNLDDEDAQREVAERVVSENLSRAATEKVIEQVAASRPRAAKVKGRGAKAKAKPGPALIRERVIRTAEGRKVIVTGRKGFDLFDLLETLREAVAKIEAEQVGEQASA